MGFADRGDLRKRVEDLRSRGIAIESEDVAAVAHTLAVGLEAVHDAGLVHRDVKPDNLLIRSHGGEAGGAGLLEPGERLQLGDLGYAKDLAASSGLTVGGGTQGFNAPEQRIGLTTVDGRADVYGASAVIFWLLANVAPPSTRREQRRLLHATLTNQRTVDALVIGLSDNPDQRFDSIADWHAALLPDSHARIESHWTPARKRRHRLGTMAIAVCVGLGVVAALGFGVAAINRRDDGPRAATIEDGRTRVEDQQGDLRVAVFGPVAVQVGESVTFTAGIDGAVSYSWIAPDGSSSNGTPTLDVTLDELGTNHVTLIGRDSDGGTLAVDFEFDVSE